MDLPCDFPSRTKHTWHPLLSSFLSISVRFWSSAYLNISSRAFKSDSLSLGVSEFSTTYPTLGSDGWRRNGGGGRVILDAPDSVGLLRSPSIVWMALTSFQKINQKHISFLSNTLCTWK